MSFDWLLLIEIFMIYLKKKSQDMPNLHRVGHLFAYESQFHLMVQTFNEWGYLHAIIMYDIKM